MTATSDATRSVSRELQLMSWALAVMIAFILLFALSSVSTLSDFTIAGLMAALSGGTRFALSLLFDA